LVVAAPALLVAAELCAEVVDGFSDPGTLVLAELLVLDGLLPTLLADVSFETGGVELVVDDWLLVGLALLGEPGIELFGEVAAAPVAL
jgi:hypothetical protein